MKPVLLLVVLGALAVIPSAAVAQIQIFSTGQYGTPETISLAPPGFGTFGGRYFIPDARLATIWQVPATGGPPTKFADTGVFSIAGLFLPSGWGDYSGTFLLSGNLAFDGAGASKYLSPGQPGNLAFSLIAPSTFGSYGGQLFVADEGGTDKPVWRVPPPLPGQTGTFAPFRGAETFALGFVVSFGLEFTPPEWGAPSLLVSDGGISIASGPGSPASNILALDPADETKDHVFATIPLHDGQFGLRQMLMLPPDFLVPSLGADGAGVLVLVSVSGSGQGGGTLGELLALDSSGAIKGSLITGSVTNKFDPRGMVLTADGHILISDSSDPIWKASPTDFAPGRGAVCAVISSVSTSSLWPPNHDLVNVGLTATSSCPAPVRVAVYSDEDDAANTGDGTFSPDARNVAAATLRLRAERNGNGDGRIYLIVVTSTDSAGTVAPSCNTVVVAHSQSKKDKDAVDSRAATARTYCQQHSGAAPAGFFVVGDGPVIGPKQ